jgi:hypothetical protein
MCNYPGTRSQAWIGIDLTVAIRRRFPHPARNGRRAKAIRSQKATKRPTRRPERKRKFLLDLTRPSAIRSCEDKEPITPG